MRDQAISQKKYVIFGVFCYLKPLWASRCCVMAGTEALKHCRHLIHEYVLNEHLHRTDLQSDRFQKNLQPRITFVAWRIQFNGNVKFKVAFLNQLF